ncbi:MAG: response regulator [Cyclobacteriaceae bacterium]|nr:response regulator [Cyclobacteriaceae bacterium]
MKEILIIDDNKVNLLELEQLLKDPDYSPVTLADPDKIWSQLILKVPDLILLEIQMSGKDGMSVLKELKAHAEYKMIPVIMMSREATENIVAACFEFGFYVPTLLFTPFVGSTTVCSFPQLLIDGNNGMLILLRSPGLFCSLR